jgi:hypothetical protein
MGKFSEIEKILKDLDKQYASKWEAEKKQEDKSKESLDQKEGEKDE